MCSLTVIVVLLFTVYNTVKSDLNDYIGFGISTGFQSSALSASKVGSITSQLNAKTYRIYGHDSGPAIAQQIISQSSTPTEIKFLIEMWDLNSITTSKVDQLISDYSSVKDNVYLINIGNEPVLNPGYMSWNLLSTKLSLVYNHLATKGSPWNNVKVTIPFSEAIVGSSWPVESAVFQDQYKAEIYNILSILDSKNGPFTMNLYPYFGEPSDYTQYALGNAQGWGGSKWYGNMLEAKYDAMLYAMENVYPGARDNIELIVTETGWSSYSASMKSSFSNVGNAKDYYKNTLKAMNNPSSILYEKKIYFFELFDEDMKGNWGIDQDWEPYFGIYDKYGNSKGIYSDPYCSNGILNGNACCSSGCISCGGNGCSSRSGGASACCYGNIMSDANSCNNNEPPCVVQN